MNGLKILTAALLAAALVAAAPAMGNPMPEPEDTSIAPWVPVVVAAGALAGLGYVLYKRHAAQRPTFVGEEVTVTLTPGRARVVGVYRFYNPGEKRRDLKLRYPFARGPEVGAPENVTVRAGDAEDVPFSWKRHDVAFELTIPSRGEAVVTVTYEQACYGREFKYILTSTRDWRRPIDAASFVVVAPAQFAPVECPYEWTEEHAAEGLVRYEFRREDFYPDVDLNLRWRRVDSDSAALDYNVGAQAGD